MFFSKQTQFIIFDLFQTENVLKNEMCLPMICGSMKFCFFSIRIKSIPGTSRNICILNQY